MGKRLWCLICVVGLFALILVGTAGADDYKVDSSGGGTHLSLNALRLNLINGLQDGASVTLMNNDNSLTRYLSVRAGDGTSLRNGTNSPLIISPATGVNTRFLNSLHGMGLDIGPGLIFKGFKATNDSGVSGGGGTIAMGDLPSLNWGVIRGTFMDSSAVGYGGAVFVYGDFTGSIRDAVFINNSSGLSGGAVSVLKSMSDGISSSTFQNNKATERGGAVSLFGVLSGGISNAVFENNSAGGDGGAVYAGGGMGFTPSGLNGGIMGTTFRNNEAGGSGGAVNVYGGFKGGIRDSVFSNNTAGTYGGALFVGAYDFEAQASLNGGISSSTFQSNKATKRGGAICLFGVLSGGISDAVFENNSAGGDGGAVYAQGGLNGNVNGSRFQGNSARNGGAIWVSGDVELSGSNVQFIDNQARYDYGHGGAIFYDAHSANSVFRLSAKSGDPILFSGNTHNPDGAGETPNSIYFGNSALANNRSISAEFNVVADGALYMFDPMASQPDDTSGELALAINKTGPGTWVLAGVSEMQSSTSWTVSEGALHLVADKNKAPAHINLSHVGSGVLGLEGATFVLKNGASLLLEPAATPHRISGQNITLESGSSVGLAHFQYGPALQDGQYTVLKLNAPNVANESNISQTSGTIAVGAYDYNYRDLGWNGNDLTMTVGGGSLNTTRSGTSALTGSSYIAGLNQATTVLSSHSRETFRSMSSASDGGGEVMTSTSLQSAPGAGENPRYQHDEQPNRVWFTPYYAYTNQSNGGDLHAPGLGLGFERLIGASAFAGLALSVSWPEYDEGGTNIDAQDLTLAVYGGGVLPWGDIELDAHVGYGWTDYDQIRHVEGERYDSDYDGEMFFVGAGLGRTFWIKETGMGLWLRPGASYDYIHIKTDGFDEGAGTYALNMSGYDQDLHRVKAGLEAGWASESGLMASAEAYYLGTYGDRVTETSGYLINDPANGFNVIGNGLDENSLGLGAKVDLPVGPNWELNIGYDFLLGEKATTHQGSAMVTFRF